MKNGINMKNRYIIGIMSLLLILSLVIGCIGSDKKSTTEPTIVPTTTTEKIIEPITTTEKSVEEETVVEETAGAVEETVVPTMTADRIDESLAYIFKVNDEKIMLDRSIRLIDLATEEGVVTIKISGDSYKLTDNIEQEIKGRRIKIVDLDGVNQTVKIIVRYIT